MSINTPLGDTLSSFYSGLLAGRSAITRWKGIDTTRVYGKVGADLSGYDRGAKLSALEKAVEPAVYRRLKKLSGKVPWATQLSMLVATDAWRDAGLSSDTFALDRVGVFVGGHNLNANYLSQEVEQFREEPDFIDGMLALHRLDTDHAGTVSEVLGARGPIFTVGAACASGNVALRCAVDEIRHHDAQAVVVVGPVLDFEPLDLHAMSLLGAITYKSFNDTPEKASRPYDTRREGFVPAHGGAALILEDWEAAQARGAHIWAEVLAVDASADANHLPQPSQEGQVALMRKVLKQAKLAPEQIDYINAHATSTPLGDLTEIRAIKEVFGPHAFRLKVNATKSMLGHTCWAAATVESVAAILQMHHGSLHPSINIEELDPEVDVDVCRGQSVKHPVRVLMKNSFGFGGINCISLFGAGDGSRKGDA